MPSYQPPLKNSAYIFYVSLVSQADTKIFKVSPTLATGDVKAAIDDAAPGNLATLPVVDADYTKRVKVSLSAAETNGDRVTVIFADASGAEWCDLTVDIATVTNQFDALATAAALTVVDDLIDTEVAAILAAVDSEVGAIKDKTDLIPAAPAAVSDIPSAATIATAVWANATRTLTGFGTLAADIWAYATRTLTSTAAAVTAAVTGSNLAIVRGVTFTATLTGLTIPAAWTKIYFTVKRTLAVVDTEAVVQIVVSNPGVGTDGLLRLNSAAGTAAQGSLVVNQGAGTIAITLADDATSVLVARTYYYDVKAIVTGTSNLLTAATVTVSDTATEALA